MRRHEDKADKFPAVLCQAKPERRPKFGVHAWNTSQRHMPIEAGGDEEAVEVCLILEGVSHVFSEAAGHTIAFSVLTLGQLLVCGPNCMWQLFKGDGKTRRNALTAIVW